jgi:phosphate:Na+ symporter
MRIAIAVADDVAALPGFDRSPQSSWPPCSGKPLSTDEDLVQLEHCARELENLQRTHRRTTLGAVANGTLTTEAAIVRVDTLRSLQALVWHAWRCTVHLIGHGATI